MSREPDPTLDEPKADNGTDGASDPGVDDPDLDGEESFPASDPPAHW